MIPKLYQKDGTTLIGNLTNCIECLVEEERNGIFEVTFQYPNTESISSSLVYDNIVICDANDTLKSSRAVISITLFSNEPSSIIKFPVRPGILILSYDLEAKDRWLMSLHFKFLDVLVVPLKVKFFAIFILL